MEFFNEALASAYLRALTMDQSEEAARDDSGLTASQAELVFYLRDNPDASTTAIAAALDKDRRTTGTQLGRLKVIGRVTQRVVNGVAFWSTL